MQRQVLMKKKIFDNGVYSNNILTNISAVTTSVTQIYFSQ